MWKNNWSILQFFLAFLLQLINWNACHISLNLKWFFNVYGCNLWSKDLDLLKWVKLYKSRSIMKHLFFQLARHQLVTHILDIIHFQASNGWNCCCYAIIIIISIHSKSTFVKFSNDEMEWSFIMQTANDHYDFFIWTENSTSINLWKDGKKKYLSVFQI